MRLHFLIFAALQGTPFVALPYASKVVGFLGDLEMETPPLGDVGIGQLIARIEPFLGYARGDSRQNQTTPSRPPIPCARDQSAPGQAFDGIRLAVWR